MLSHARVPYMRPAVAALPNVGRLAHAGSSNKQMRALHLNECPFPPSPKVVEAIRAAAGNVNRYPDSQVRKLGTVLSERTGVAPERIVFGTGSEELLNLLGLIALGPGDNVVISTPSFARYGRSAQLAGAGVKRIKLRDDGRNDIAAQLAAVDGATRILYCALPNNPTGCLNDASEVEQLVTSTPDDVLLAIDEAYYEYARYAGGPDVLAALARRKGPWIVLRTFSKAYCLAGLRLGYALCSSDDVAGALGKTRTAFNAALLAQAAALAAIEDEAHLAKVLDTCATERERLRKGCLALGLHPLPTVTNFMSIRVPMRAADVVAGMNERGILIGLWGDADGADMIRISMGLAEDTDAVLSALNDILRARAA